MGRNHLFPWVGWGGGGLFIAAWGVANVWYGLGWEESEGEKGWGGGRGSVLNGRGGAD